MVEGGGGTPRHIRAPLDPPNIDWKKPKEVRQNDNFKIK